MDKASRKPKILHWVQEMNKNAISINENCQFFEELLKTQLIN